MNVKKAEEPEGDWSPVSESVNSLRRLLFSW